MIKIRILVCFLAFFNLAAYAQEYDYSSDFHQIIKLDNQVSERFDYLNHHEDLFQSKSVITIETIADKYGKPLLYLVSEFDSASNKSYIQIIDKNFRIAENGIIDTIVPGVGLSTNAFGIILNPDKTKAYVFISSGGVYQHSKLGLDYVERLGYHEIDLAADRLSVGERKDISQHYMFNVAFAKHESEPNKIWIASQSLDSLYIYEFDFESSKLVSSIKNSSNKCAAYLMRFSKSGRSLSICNRWYKKEYPESLNVKFDSYAFNKETGSIELINSIEFNEFEPAFSSQPGIKNGKVSDMTYWKSSEDTILFTYSGNSCKDFIGLLDISNNKFKEYFLTPAIPSHIGYVIGKFIYNMDGELYLLNNTEVGANAIVKSSIYSYFIDSFSSKNNSVYSRLKFLGSYRRIHSTYGNASTNRLQTFHKLDFLSRQNCDSTLILKFSGDSSFYSSLYWEVNGEPMADGDSLVILINSLSPIKVKLVGETEWGYKRMLEKEIDIDPYYLKPFALFNLEDTVGCQWLEFKFLNNSHASDKGFGIKNYWHVDDQIDTLDYTTNFSKVFTESGLYSVSLIIDDGVCTDTFSHEEKVYIQPAPNPSFSLAMDTICGFKEAIVVREQTDPIDSIWINWGQQEITDKLNSKNYSFTYDNGSDTVYSVKLRLFGITGCVTSDSQELTYFQSFDLSSAPSIYSISTNLENYNEIQLSDLEHSLKYEIYKDQEFLDSTRSLDYIDNEIVNGKHSYKVRAINRCQEQSSFSEIKVSAFIDGMAESENRASVITHNSDLNPIEDPDHFILLAGPSELQLSNSLFTIIQNDLVDQNFSENGNDTSKVYRLGISNNKDVAYSNTISVNYSPFIFIPNSFSPNNDQLNDVFKPTVLGVRHYEMEIYNKWGQLIYKGMKGWDGEFIGAPAQSDIYLYKIHAVSNVGISIYRTGTVVLIR